MGNKKTLKNIVYNSAYHIFAILIPVITTPFVSRKLGAAGIGEYSYAYSISSYFALFIKLGLANYGNRTIAIARGKGDDISKEFWSIYLFQLAMGLFVNFIYLMYCFLLARSITIPMIILFYLLSVSIDITWFYWGLENFKLTVTRDFVIKIITTLSIFIFIKNSSDVWKYALILSFGSFLSQALLWKNIKQFIHWVKPSLKDIVKHIKPNLVLFVPSVAVSVYKIMDKIMLGAIVSTIEVGFYHSSERVLQVPMALITSLGTVMQPRISNLIAKNTDLKYITSIVKKSLAFSLFLSTSIGFGVMTILDEFVPLFYGSGFDKCKELLLILLPSCMFLSFTNVFKSQYMIPNKLDRQYTIALFVGAFVNLVINLLLIPRVASIGAAWGTFFAELFVMLVITKMIKRFVNIWDYYKLSLPFVISGLVMFVTCRRITFNLGTGCILLLKIIIGALVYIFTLFIFFTCGKLPREIGVISIKDLHNKIIRKRNYTRSE